MKNIPTNLITPLFLESLFYVSSHTDHFIDTVRNYSKIFFEELVRLAAHHHDNGRLLNPNINLLLHFWCLICRIYRVNWLVDIQNSWFTWGKHNEIFSLRKCGQILRMWIFAEKVWTFAFNVIGECWQAFYDWSSKFCWYLSDSIWNKSVLLLILKLELKTIMRKFCFLDLLVSPT